MTAQPLSPHGTNQHGNGGGLYSSTKSSPKADRSDYLTARIARDRPDIWERMKRGEFDSVKAAAREAGIPLPQPRRTMSLSDNVVRVADKLRRHYTQEQVQRIAERLLAQEDGAGPDARNRIARNWRLPRLQSDTLYVIITTD